MNSKININDTYKPSDDIVAREIQGEFIIIPVTSAAAEDDAIFTLNETGRAIWSELDGKSSLKNISEKMCKKFQVESGAVEKDILGFAAELLKRSMITGVSN